MSEIEIKNQKNTELGLLPKDWNIYKVKDVADTKAGGTPSRKVKEYYDGTIPWVKSGELEDNFINDTEEKLSEEALSKSSAKLFPQGSLLIAMYGATVGKTALLNITASTNQAICAIFPNNKLLYNPYLRYYFIFARDRLLTERYGGAQSNISQTLIRNFKIPLPPLPEQKKIAAILSRVQEAKEKTEAVIEASKALKKSMMKHLFTYGPVAVKKADKIKMQEFQKDKVPNNWQIAKIEDFYNFTKKPRNISIHGEEALPFIPMEGISEKYKLATWIKKRKRDISSGTFVFKNDLIVAKITPSFENGKQAILSNLPGEYGYATTEVWALHPRNEETLNNYLYEYLKIPEVRNEIAGKMEGSTGRQRVSRGVLGHTLFPKPKMKEQKDIVEMLDGLDNKLQTEENKKVSLEKLFQSVLKNLMTGKLRVNNIDIPL